MTAPKHDPEGISIIQAHAEGAESLRSADVTEARLEAGSLLGHALNRDRTYLITHGNDMVTDEPLDRFRTLIARRAAREPLQYILGYQEFFKLKFEVTPEVLFRGRNRLSSKQSWNLRPCQSLSILEWTAQDAIVIR